MDLKELFGKQPNYVQFPPEEAPTLEKFISERAMIPHDAKPAPAPADTNKIPNMFGGSLMPGEDSVSSAYSAPKSVVDPVDTETKAAALESQPVNEGRLAEIKAMFGYQPSPADMMEQPQMPERQPAMDIASIKKTMDKDGYKLGFEDMLPALAPLAADLLTGGTGAGIPVAAGYLDKIQKDNASKNATLEKYLMEIEKSRATAKGKSSGESKLMAELMKQRRFEDAQKQRKSMADRSFVASQIDTINKDKDFQTAKARYSATNDAINVLNQKNWAGDQGAGFLFAKGIFGEVGSLTNEERTAFIANPFYENKFNSLFQKYLKDGTFTDEDRSDLQELALHMRKRAEADLDLISNNYADIAGSLGVDIKPQVQALIRRNPVEPKRILKNKGAAQQKTVQRMGKDGNIYTYQFNEKTGKYE